MFDNKKKQWFKVGEKNIFFLLFCLFLTNYEMFFCVDCFIFSQICQTIFPAVISF